MESFLRLFGNLTVEWVAVVIVAIVFLVKIYKIVKNYFSEKALAEKEKSRQNAGCHRSGKSIPKMASAEHRHPEKIHGGNRRIAGGQKENNKRLEKMEQENQRRERNKLRDRILQS